LGQSVHDVTTRKKSLNNWGKGGQQHKYPLKIRGRRWGPLGPLNLPENSRTFTGKPRGEERKSWDQ